MREAHCIFTDVVKAWPLHCTIIVMAVAEEVHYCPSHRLGAMQQRMHQNSACLALV